MRILVLGGAGKMGSLAVQDLILNPRVDEVVLADINSEAAEEIIAYLRSPKLTIRIVNLTDHDNLAQALADVDACINATIYYTNLSVMKACLEAKTHYTDLGGLFHTTRKQLELNEQFERAGISAVLGMGSAPGIPNIQSRLAADKLDTIEYIRIYDGILPAPSTTPVFSYAVPTIIDEMTMRPMVFRGGVFIECEPVSEHETYWFSRPLGLLTMHLSLHSEVATLPISFAEKGIRECFFKINYWGMPEEVVAKVRTLAEFGFASTEPVSIPEGIVKPRDLMVAMMNKYVPPITSFLDPPTRVPPDWVKEIVTEVKGTKQGKSIIYRIGTLTCKSSLPTGVAPARGAVWQAAGRVASGVHAPENVFEPEAFLKELEERDIYTQVTVTESL
jgi:saccharopine dehydrogenase-like NADP-dependent oxidoreductase